MMPIDLHLVSWNRPKMTKLVIDTIHRNTHRDNFRLIVIDNGSGKETTEMLKTLHDNGRIDELHMMGQNGGLEAARQWLLLNSSLLDSGFFICIDNDCLPPPIVNEVDWIELLFDLMHRYEGHAAIACRTQVMIGTGNIFEQADKDGSELVDFPHPGGSLRIMLREAVEQVGGWDRGAEGRGAEERFICGKLRDAGYATAFAAKIPCLHLFGTRGANETDRWGYDKDLKPEDTGHSDIWHPVLTNGDDREDVELFAGKEAMEEYFS